MDWRGVAKRGSAASFYLYDRGEGGRFVSLDMSRWTVPNWIAGLRVKIGCQLGQDVLVRGDWREELKRQVYLRRGEEKRSLAADLHTPRIGPTQLSRRRTFAGLAGGDSSVVFSDMAVSWQYVPWHRCIICAPSKDKTGLVFLASSPSFLRLSVPPPDSADCGRIAYRGRGCTALFSHPCVYLC